MNRLKSSLLSLLLVLTAAAAAVAQTNYVRGFPAGQGVYYNGYYGAAPSYAYAAPQTAYYPPAYQARQAYYPSGVAVAPSAQAGRIAYYAPPAVADYAPSSPGYAISPAGGASAGAEAFAYYGQQQPLNYVPPTYRYETRMMQVPVTYYRPVVVYQPGAVAATTCQRASTATQCQPQRSRLFSWLHGNSASTTCNYGSCSAAPAACGAVPYYNTVPGALAPATVVPTTPSRGFNNILTPRTTVPAPATGVIGVPADNQPFIAPGTVVPGTSIPGSFRTLPGTTTPTRPDSFNPSSGLGTGASSNPSTVNRPVFGSKFRANPDKSISDIQLSRPTISEPGMKQPQVSAPASSIRPVPDPEPGQRIKPGSRAPALINPNDKTARARAIQPLGAATYGVVPARWPEKSHEVNYKVQAASTEMPAAQKTAPQEEKWDDSGWKSAR